MIITRITIKTITTACICIYIYIYYTHTFANNCYISQHVFISLNVMTIYSHCCQGLGNSTCIFAFLIGSLSLAWCYATHMCGGDATLEDLDLQLLHENTTDLRWLLRLWRNANRIENWVSFASKKPLQNQEQTQTKDGNNRCNFLHANFEEHTATPLQISQNIQKQQDQQQVGLSKTIKVCAENHPVGCYCHIFIYTYTYTAISTFHLSGCSPADFHAPGRGPFFDGFT